MPLIDSEDKRVRGGGLSMGLLPGPAFHVLLILFICCWSLGHFCPEIIGAIISKVWLTSCVSLLIPAGTVHFFNKMYQKSTNKVPLICPSLVPLSYL